MAARAHRLFVEAIDTEFTLEGERAHYLRDVLRLRVDNEVVIFDGAIEHLATINAIGKRTCTIETGRALRRARNRPRVHLCHAAIKSSLDAVAQSATELGITDFWVFGADRSNARPHIRHDRLERIIQSAAEQCQRISIPALHSASDLTSLTASLAAARVFFGDTQVDASATFDGVEPTNDVAIIIGPEGGWTDAETARLVSAGAHPVHLGAQVLRATTAGLTALAALHAVRGWPADTESVTVANG